MVGHSSSVPEVALLFVVSLPICGPSGGATAVDHSRV